MIQHSDTFETMPVGIVLRRSPGVTRWARWSWRVVAAMPGAPNADWRVLRKQGDVCDFHADTPNVELHRADTESYIHGLKAQVPCLYVVMRETDEENRPFEIVVVTASPYEAQDYADNGEDVIEKITMPDAVLEWVESFVGLHHKEEVFKKRKRDKKNIKLVEDGVGDPRIQQLVDVYRAPAQAKKERLQ